MKSFLILCFVVFSVTPFWATASGKILHAFDSRDGEFPLAPLTVDASGNLYGTTPTGGANVGGTVFMLSPVNGSWKLTVLHSFGAFTGDGLAPQGGVVFDSAGNLYGTTYQGGVFGFGTVYQLAPSGGAWKYKVLHGFSGLNGDGAYPGGTPVVDTAGNIYGATESGGASQRGTVFELIPQPGGNWQQSVLYGLQSSDGLLDNVIFGPDGSLYGSPREGGNGAGLILRVSPSSGSGWAGSVIYTFESRGDAFCACGIAFDGDGNIVGASLDGGSNGKGTLFEIPHNTDGSWGPDVIIHSFSGGGDGSYPQGSPALDANGNIFGMTRAGSRNGKGVVYEFSPAGEDKYSGVLLHSFAGGNDGAYPISGPTLDKNGNVYGTTYSGGIYGAGTAWQVTP
jgi:uncharacterized repeat protein (TIGR03803 family)